MNNSTKVAGSLLVASLGALGCGPAYEVEDADDVVSYQAPVVEYVAAPPTVIYVQCPAVGPSPCAPPPPVAPQVIYAAPVVAAPAPVLGGHADPLVQRVVELHYAKFRRCYEKGLRRDPNLAGSVVVRMKVDRDGEVDKAHDHGSSLRDRRVVKCVLDEFEDLDFKQSVGKFVVYPLQFTPSVMGYRG
jgi:hypothetical protein